MTVRQRWMRWLAPLVVVALLLVGAWLWLGVYTRHAAGAVVPDLRGLTLEEAVQHVEGRDLFVEIIDSVYNDELPKGTVTDQDPDADNVVKPGRRIYVVMNAQQPKMIDMPALVDLSKRQALSVLEVLGLKVDALQYRPDPCVDCVVAQLHNGRPIAPDERIRRGEVVTLVLGSGDGGTRVQVPDVTGMSWNEAKATLHLAGLNPGLVVAVEGCDNTGCDTALARVVRQTPVGTPSNMIGAGGAIDLWLSLLPADTISQ